MDPKRLARSLIKRAWRQMFEVAQRGGANILPHYFYSEVPDMRTLRSGDGWKKARSLVGVAGADTATQLEFARSCCPAELIERQRRGDIYERAIEHNEPGFGEIEADFLHCFITSQRPSKVVQIGCGVSTSVMLSAAREADHDVDIVCVDPFPTEFLKHADAAGELTLIGAPAQEVPIETLTDLKAGDLLFVDSTHTVKPGSEVNIIMLEVLPRLAKGVRVHFHDIYLPYDYARGILTGTLFFTNESVLLHAFLVGNRSVRILASLSMLHYACASELQQLLPNYRPASNDHGLNTSSTAEGHFPSSTYLEITG